MVKSPYRNCSCKVFTLPLPHMDPRTECFVEFSGYICRQTSRLSLIYKVTGLLKNATDVPALEGGILLEQIVARLVI